MPGPVPAEVRALLDLATGFFLFGLEVDFLRRVTGQYLPGAAACQHDILADGCGNSWYVDVRSDGSWGGVYFASHDPPVLLVESPDLASFLSDLLLRHAEGSDAKRTLVGDDPSGLWPENPNARSVAQSRSDGDPVIRAFALALPESALIVDLRGALPGTGFSWDCFGPRTEIRCSGDEPVFALVPPAGFQESGRARKGRGLLRRLFGR